MSWPVLPSDAAKRVELSATQTSEPQTVAMERSPCTGPMRLRRLRWQVLLPALLITGGGPTLASFSVVEPSVTVLAMATASANAVAYSPLALASRQVPSRVLSNVVQITSPASTAVLARSAPMEAHRLPCRRTRPSICHPTPATHDLPRRETRPTVKAAALSGPSPS